MLSIFIIFLSFSIPLLYKQKVENNYLNLQLFFILIHHVVSVIIFFQSTELLSSINFFDSNGFHNRALISEWDGKNFYDGAIIFSYVLSFFYKFSSYPLLVGQSLSVLAFSISTIVLYFIIKELNLLKYSVAILFLYTINPSDILLTSIVMREAWELLFFMLGCFFSVKILKQTKFSLKYCLFMLLSFLLSGILHRAMLPAGGAIIVNTLLVHSFFIDKKQFLKFNILLCLSFLRYFTLIYLSFLLIKLYHPKILDQVTLYAHGIPTTRAFYGNIFNGSFFSILNQFFYFMFYPFFWITPENYKDILAIVMSISRGALLIFSIYLITNSQNYKEYMIRKNLLISVLSIAFIYSIGTNNYGTSLRHQILSFWGLSLLGVPGMIMYVKKYLSINKNNYSYAA